MKFDLVSIGDASWDVFIVPSESETLCQLDDKECLICFNYGDKIPVETMESSVGGNSANNAVGMSRLGLKSAAVLTLGSDDIGDQIIEKLIKENVNTSLISRQKEMRSNYSTVIVVRGERTIFTYKSENEYMIPEIPECSWIYLTSMGNKFQSSYQAVVDHVKVNPSIKLAFNPGSRQVRAGYESIKNVLEVSHIVYVNRQEAESITGFPNSHGRERELLEKTASLGPKIAVITDGTGGSYLYDGNMYLHCGVMPIDSYERTGAGDAFGSGMLSALVQGKSIDEALLWGTANSASVIGYAGAQRGLLTLEKMPEWLGRAQSSEVGVVKI